MTTARRKGFTLVETVAAIVILALAVPPMLWAVRESARQRVNPMLASRARWLATEKLEDIIADRHSTTARGWDYVSDPAEWSTRYPDESPVDATNYPQFDRAVTFLETQADLTTPDTDGGYLNVSVTVSWPDATGTTQSLSISTVLTEYNPT